MSDGLYLMRLEQKKNELGVVMFSVLTICLYDGAAVMAELAGEPAEAIYAHFRTLTDHGIRDSFVDGLLMGLRIAGQILNEGGVDFRVARVEEKS